MPNLDQLTEKGGALAELAMKYLPSVVGAVVILFIAWIVAGWIGHVVERALNRGKVDTTLTRFFSKTAKWLVIVLAVLTSLSAFGIETTSFAAVIGAAGLAVGLAFQGTLSNFSAGVMLLFFRPFKVGDFVKVGGEAGTVYAIELFTTTLDTPGNERVILPNSVVFGSNIENLTYHSIRRVNIPVGVDYSADMNATRKALEKATEKVSSKTTENPPQVFLDSLGDSAINWYVRVWTPTDKYWDVWEETVQAIKESLDEAGIGIPFPQQDVHMYQMNSQQ